MFKYTLTKENSNFIKLLAETTQFVKLIYTEVFLTKNYKTSLNRYRLKPFYDLVKNSNDIKRTTRKVVSSEFGYSNSVKFYFARLERIKEELCKILIFYVIFLISIS